MQPSPARAPRFYCDASLPPGATVALPERAARHAAALRLREGDAVVLFNGDGHESAATLSGLGKRGAACLVRSRRAVDRELEERKTAGSGSPPEPGSATNASAPDPGGNDATQAGRSDPSGVEASTSPSPPASPGDGGDTKAGRGRARGPGKATESAPPAGPTQAEAAEQAAFDQAHADDTDPGEFAR